MPIPTVPDVSDADDPGIGAAARALVKLKALGVETDDESLVGVEPKVRAAEPAFEPLYAATRDRAPVTLPSASRNSSSRYRSQPCSASLNDQ